MSVADEDNRRVLRDMVAGWTAHRAEECGEPLCMGEQHMLAFRAAIAVDPAWPTRMVLIAVGEMAQLQNQLDVQRGLTADAAAQAMGLDADLVDAHGQIAGLEQRVSGLLAELTAWEEASDVIGPVLPVADHG